MRVEQRSRESRHLKRLHPFFKLLAVLALFVFSLAVSRPLPLAVVLACLLLVLLGDGHSRLLYKLAPVALILGGFIYLVSVWLGGTAANSLVSALRILLFGCASLFFGATTSPSQLLRSLYVLNIPPSISLGLLVAFRFIPVLAEEMVKIHQAYFLRAKSRGYFMAHAYRGLMVPFVFRLLTLTDNLTLSLHGRAFGSGSFAAPYRRPAARIIDWVFLLTLFCLLGVIGWMC